ncbi:MAG: response regulator transcription factor [Planctomycetes bacterium]|nr:response regulator transcription factor [Planctomycetota bacterium]
MKRHESHGSTRRIPAAGSRILLVEDDAKLASQVRANLERDGFAVDWVDQGDSVLACDPDRYDLVILDLMLPGMHGLDVMKHLRQRSDLPVMILSARNETDDKVKAFRFGADDYMTKPFWPEELVARVRARLRRPGLLRDGRIERGELVIDLPARRVLLGDREIDLTRAEFNLLAALARRAGEALTRHALVEASLDGEAESGDRALDVHVSRLRRKLGPAAEAVVTVWGVGYRFDPGDPR